MSDKIQLEVTTIELEALEDALGFWADDDAQCVAPYQFAVVEQLRAVIREKLKSGGLLTSIEGTPEAEAWYELHAECEKCGNWVPKEQLKTCDEQASCPECIECIEIFSE